MSKSKPIKFRRGVEFGMVGTGKAGEILSRRDKLKLAKNQRRLWRKFRKEFED